MNSWNTRRAMAWVVGVILLAGSGVTGCKPAPSGRLQGYVEGEFVHVASPLAGALELIPVQRGREVGAGDLLFALESGAELAARVQAAERLEEGRARLADARKGKRPEEIEAVDAQLKQARAALALSEKELTRQTELSRTGTASVSDLDRARALRDQDQERVAQLVAELQTARLGLRGDLVTAAEANVRALEGALAKAEWDLSQKKQVAPQAGLVFDTLYRKGEWVPAGRPVVVLLPPGNIKVRTFVPEPLVGSIRVGSEVRVSVDGVSGDVEGRVSFISPRAEYTPPVIYSQGSREKLMFLVEISVAPGVAGGLHPGQPVDVELKR